MLLLCTYELCNYISFQVKMVRAGSITAVARHSGLSLLLQLFWRPRDTISLQTMARYQSRVCGGVRVGRVPSS